MGIIVGGVVFVVVIVAGLGSIYTINVRKKSKEKELESNSNSLAPSSPSYNMYNAPQTPMITMQSSPSSVPGSYGHYNNQTSAYSGSPIASPVSPAHSINQPVNAFNKAVAYEAIPFNSTLKQKTSSDSIYAGPMSPIAPAQSPHMPPILFNGNISSPGPVSQNIMSPVQPPVMLSGPIPSQLYTSPNIPPGSMGNSADQPPILSSLANSKKNYQ
ncbi:hypothetical protein HDV01_004802 [Terramyces sp. JEL0728]|nr:hypothetical protein HDV01_004802 [Terramyces sp. JEL0728]